VKTTGVAEGDGQHTFGLIVGRFQRRGEFCLVPRVPFASLITPWAILFIAFGDKIEKC
jgi:hypothetical protein